MALGKKSFLIRDILESQGTTGFSSLQENPRIIEWIIQNRVEPLSHQATTWAQEGPCVELDHEAPASGDLRPFDMEQLDASLEVSPLIQNWLSISRVSAALTQSGLPSPPSYNSYGTEKRPFQTSSSALYQNLYYYAIQQQINASLIDRISNDDNCPFDSTRNQNANFDQQVILNQRHLMPNANSHKTKLTGSKSKQASNEQKEKQKLSSKPKPKTISNKSDTKKVARGGRSQSSLQEPRDVGLDLTQSNGNKSWSSICECNCDDDEAMEDGAKCGTKCKRCKKLRRNRTVFTELQLMGLERRFDSQKYLSTPDRADLARALGLTQLQVKTWYQNRRMKWKKQVMQNGCPFPPTKPKGRPKKDSIPTYGMEFTNSILCPIFASHNNVSQSSSNGLISYTSISSS